MRQLLLLLIFGLSGTINAQSLDYHTKKGYAISGYDVVSYFNDNPQLGSENYVAMYDGVNYRFVNEANKKMFQANPEGYVPQYGGYCAYAMAVASKKVPVNPETFEIRDDKLYLFYNSGKNNTLESWLDESPEALRKKADDNWDNVKFLRR